MKLNRLIRNIAVFATAALISGVASSYTIFFGEDLNNSATTRLASTPNATAASNSFLANLIGVGTETFETIAPGTGVPLNLNFPGAGAATLAGGNGQVVSVPVGTNGFGRYPISGSNYFEVTALAAGTFNITFGAPVAAFGFWGVDIGDFGGTIELALVDGSSTVIDLGNTVGNNASTDGSVLFFGLIGSVAQQFTGIAFNLTSDPGNRDVFAFDDMTIGSIEQVRPVPEPDSLLLVGLALTIAGGVARLRRRKS